MEFTITQGVLVNGVYQESSRLTIQVNNVDPKISEVIRAILVQVPLPSYLLRKKDYLYLVDAETNRRLDPGKKASDCDLKDGSILRLMCAIR